MAITVVNFPPVYSPAYNDAIFVVSSTNSSEVNFKFVADIYIGTDVIRVTASKDPVYDRGVFNFGRIIESYISSDISKSTYGFQQNLNSYIIYSVQFGEQYGSVPVIYPSLAAATGFNSWNGILDFLDYKDYNGSNYLLNASSIKSLLTNKPATVNIRDNEDAWLYASVASSGVIFDARIRTYDSVGALIQTVKVANPYQAISSTNDKFIRFGCGTSNINLIASSGVISGSLPIITASVASYDVTFETQSGTLVSTPQVYLIDNTCTRNVSYRFHFRNELGGFDSYTFYRGSKKTREIKRSSYKKSVNRMASASSYTYNKSDRESTQIDIVIKGKIKVLSDWIKEVDFIWLEQLIESPEVYVDDSTHGLVAVNILNSTHEIKQDSQDKLVNLELEFEYSFDRYRR